VAGFGKVRNVAVDGRVLWCSRRAAPASARMCSGEGVLRSQRVSFSRVRLACCFVVDCACVPRGDGLLMISLLRGVIAQLVERLVRNEIQLGGPISPSPGPTWTIAN